MAGDGEKKTAAKEAAKKLPVFASAEATKAEGGQLRFWRVSPGRLDLGSWPPDCDPEELREACEQADGKAMKKGAKYSAILYDANGDYVTSTTWRYFDRADATAEPEAKEETGPDPYERILSLTDASNARMLAQMDALNRTYMDRMRSEAREREAAHKQDLERIRVEGAQQLERIRLEGQQSMERERQWTSAQLERDRQFFAELGKKGDGEGSILSTLLFGMRLRDEIKGDDDDEKGMLSGLMDKVGARLMKRLDPDDPFAARRNGGPRREREREDSDDDEDEKPRRKAGPSAKERDAQRQAAAFRAMVETLDDEGLAAAVVSLVRQGALDVATLRVIVDGEADASLKEAYGANRVDKVKRAAETALRALRDQDAPEADAVNPEETTGDDGDPES